ncbi:carboxypeptidase regulatory-like domain-containing protein [Terriglobus sp. 2YAB30_2]|uniref:carboxypeptidase regulatory-like domain-containing protein n=1 Tax=Terriglobus sp. 2YAB30_2 TaxID=3233023 RepID=UPI003F9512FA
MNEPLQPGHHLDADQLAAFVEGALTEQERQESLAHMAVCEQCRDIAFLMQPEMAAESAAVAAPRLPFWRRFTPLVYASGLGVCATVLIVFAWMHQGPPPPPRSNVAQVVPAPPVSQIPARTASEVPAAPPNRAQNQKKAEPPPATSPKAVEPALASAKTPMPSADTAAIPAIAARQNVRMSQPATAAAGLAPLNNTQVINGRNFSTSLAIQPVVNSATPTLQFPPPNGQLALRIEHGQPLAGPQAKVAGVVLDLSGATISGATVTLRQPNTPLRQTKTDNAGNFTLASLPAGRYNLEIAAPGFRTVTQPLDLQANDLALLTSQVPVGSTSESVEVTAEAPALLTESASVASIPVEMKLPHNAEVANTVYRGKRVLALDVTGKVYFSTNSGKRWKTIKPLWDGKVSQIEAAEHGEGFSLTTESGGVWSSEDGKHWRKY